MTKIKRSLLIGLFLIMQHANASYFRSMDYDDIRKEGGFSSDTLQNVMQITPSGDSLNFDEKEELINNVNLLNLRTLSLEDQSIDDEFIDSLCNNTSLKRIINLNLSKNIGVTNQSIQNILDSDILGSIRDLPQISGRFGIPATCIYIKAEGTSVVPPKIGIRYFDEHRFDFSIQYRHILKDTETSPSTDNGIKFVEVTL